MRPIVKVQPTQFDKALEGLCIFALIGVILATACALARLPGTIPTHFGPSGPDAYGTKFTLLILPILTVGLYAFLTFMGRFPHTFNTYRVEITEENAERQYTLAVRLLRGIKLLVVCFLGGIQSTIIREIAGETPSTGSWLATAFVVAIAAILAIYFRAAKRIS